jgi:hypothetical protein
LVGKNTSHFLSDILGWSKVHERMLKNPNLNMVLLVCKEYGLEPGTYYRKRFLH